MANTYTQMYVHVVFAVWGRANVIKDVNRVEVEKYVSGISLINGANYLLFILILIIPIFYSDYIRQFQSPI